MAPYIHWNLLNARFVGHKNTTKIKSDKQECDKLVQECVACHDYTLEYTQSTYGRQRFSIVTKSSYPEPVLRLLPTQEQPSELDMDTGDGGDSHDVELAEEVEPSENQP
eukprot:12183354-Karenia_brevis.AAC.1